jgi:hypothetical protein
MDKFALVPYLTYQRWKKQENEKTSILDNNEDQIKQELLENLHSQCNDIEQKGAGGNDKTEKSLIENKQSNIVGSKETTPSSLQPNELVSPPPGIPKIKRRRKIDNERLRTKVIEWKTLPKNVK